MDRAEVIDRTAEYVRTELYDDASGHDWWHVARVRDMAVALTRHETADAYVVELAALLHDISDYKLNGGDEDKGPKVAYEWLEGLGESDRIASAVAAIVGDISFKGAGTPASMSTREGMIVQDADRLDAIGAIGVARAFAYGGFAGQPMHDPAIEAGFHRNRQEYRERKGTTVTHFYEKLFLLRDGMHTEGARRLARSRHAFMETFLAEFLREWDAQDSD